MDELMPPKYSVPLILMALGGLVILGTLYLGILNLEDNAKIFNKTIIVEGKICQDYTPNMGMIQDENGEIYVISTKDCDKFPYQKTVNISYRHIHPTAFTEEYDFNKIVELSTLYPIIPATIDRCNQPSEEVVIIVSVYQNSTDKDPLWTELKASTDCGNIRHAGYSQNHILLVSPTEKLTVTITRTFNPDTGNTTLITTKPITFYPTEPEYDIVLKEIQ